MATILVQPTADIGTPQNNDNLQLFFNVVVPQTGLNPADFGMALDVAYTWYVVSNGVSYTVNTPAGAAPSVIKARALAGDAFANTVNITLPTSISDGNLLVMVAALGAETGTFTAPAGWATYLEHNGTRNKTVVLTKTASGDSSAAVPLVNTLSNRVTAGFFEIANASGIVDHTIAADSLDGTELDLLSSADTVALAVTNTERSFLIGGGPTGWDNFEAVSAQPPITTSSTHTSTAVATLTANAQTFDPDAFTMGSGSESGAAFADGTYLFGVR